MAPPWLQGLGSSGSVMVIVPKSPRCHGEGRGSFAAQEGARVLRRVSGVYEAGGEMEFSNSAWSHRPEWSQVTGNIGGT